VAGVIAACIILATTIAIVVFPRGGTTPARTYFVSPTGRGTACVSSSPCALQTAKSHVESASSTMGGDLVVQLAGGTYPLKAPLTFDSSDSGQNGHVVRYQAAPGSKPILSGGTSISGWTLHDSSRGIYEAAVPVGFKTRQLYVNGVRAVLANEDAGTALGTMTQTTTGYTITNRAIDSWTNPTDIDFSYPSQGRNAAYVSGSWTDSFCGVSSVSGLTITMEEPCYRNASDGTTNPDPVVGLPSFIEDNYALLSEPGQFYLDSDAGRIYYIPRSGEAMATATVVAPAAQSLLSAGSVHDIQFVGLTFEFATWLPSPTQGVVDTQANELQTTNYLTPALMPSNLTFKDCNNVLFQGNTLTHLGGGAISFDGGGSNNSIIGNSITDVSGSGISIGDGDSYSVPPSTMESGDVFNDNYIHDVAIEYLGGAGIFAGWVENTDIDHNEVSDTPWVGISLGWGWGSNPNAMENNHIDDNYIHDVMTSALFDGGGIYVNNGQGGSLAQPSTITGNYIIGDSQVYGSIYLDAGASNFNVFDNVVAHTADNWVFLQEGPNPAVSNNVEHNFSDTSVISPYNATNTIRNNQTGLTTWTAAAKRSMANAGLQAAYAPLAPSPAPRDLSYLTPASASSGFAIFGNDGNSMTSWASAAGDATPSWRTDLGAPHTLEKIQVLFGRGTDNPGERKNFQVWVTNSDATSHFTVACSQGPLPIPYGGSFQCTLPTGQWRYVALVKTDGQPFSFGEVRVYGY
jgi:hypothetical protein